MEVPNVESGAVDMEIPSEESGTVDIMDNTLKLLLNCQNNGEVVANRSRPTIFMVPSVFRDLSPSSFDPKVVSIGPLHRQDERLKVFEDEKQLYFHRWLQRNGLVPEQMLQIYAEKVIHSIERIKACYGPGPMTSSDSELATMMVIDGCFILMFLWSLYHDEGNLLITQPISRDLLLIENQIPYFVIEIIYDCTDALVPSGEVAIVNDFSLTWFTVVLLDYSYIFEGKRAVRNVSLPSTPDHFLGLIHTYYLPAEPIPSLDLPFPIGHSAMELDRAGMKFKSFDDAHWAMTIELKFRSWFPTFMAFPPFSWFRWPTLRMPKMRISDATELILRNLIIYEHSITEAKQYIASYAYAMDMLINTPEDVAVLVNSGVIISFLGSNEDAANLINNLCKYLTLLEFSYRRQWTDMDTYYSSYWPNTFAGLKRTYFNNPWSIIALCAALVLFALTIVQTIFSIIAT